MKFLALEVDVPGISTEQYRPHLVPEARKVWKLYQQGIIRELYFRGDQNNAVLVLECDGLEDANQALHSLPLVKEGLIAFDVIPLIPYPGFSRLFADDLIK